MAEEPKVRAVDRPRAKPRAAKKANWSRERRHKHLVKIDERVRNGATVEDDSLAFVLDELDNTIRRASSEVSGVFLGGLGVGAILASLVGWGLSKR